MEARGRVERWAEDNEGRGQKETGEVGQANGLMREGVRRRGNRWGK